MGKVEEYRFSTIDGGITGLEIAGDGFFKVRSLVDGATIIAIAPRTIMLKDAAITSAIALENSFLAGVESAAAIVREKAVDLKNNASEAGKKLSANFNEAVSKLRQRSEEGDRELEQELLKQDSSEWDTNSHHEDSIANKPEPQAEQEDGDVRKTQEKPMQPDQEENASTFNNE